MNSPVIFDEENKVLADMPIPHPEHRGMGYALIRAGMANSRGDAALILAVALGLLVATSIYFIASAIPEPPVLGGDTLRPGESVPEYVR